MGYDLIRERIFPLKVGGEKCTCDIYESLAYIAPHCKKGFVLPGWGKEKQ